MNKLALLVSALCLLTLFSFWALVEFVLNSHCTKLNDILSSEKDRAEVVSFLYKVSESQNLASFLESTRGQLFSFSEFAELDVEIPKVLSDRFEDLSLFILTDQNDKDFSKKYRVLELGVGVHGALLIFKNNKRDFSFRVDSAHRGAGAMLDSPRVECTAHKR